MKDSDLVMNTSNMLESQNKEKEDGKKNKKSEEHKEVKSGKDQEGSSKNLLPNKRKKKIIHGERKMQTKRVKENQRSNSKLSMKEGMDANDHVQQATPKPLDKNKDETYKEMTQIEKLQEQNERKKQKDHDDSFEEEIPHNQQEGQDDINGEFEINTITSKDILPSNIDNTLQENNIASGSTLSTSAEKVENYYRSKQEIPKSTKFRSIVDIYKSTNRLSSPEDEYNWSCSNTLENKKSEVQIDDKTGKDQEGTFEETPLNKQKQKVIHGEFENFDENCLENNVDNTNDKKDENYQVSEGISKDKMFNSLLHLCEILQDEIPKESNESNIRKEQNDSFEEELPDQQQEEDINAEAELNRVTCDDTVNYGSKLWARDENTRNYRIMQGIPRSIKFRSINNLYQCTDRLSSIEDEFNWNLSTKEDSNMSLSEKGDSSINTNKKDVGCERKCSEKKNDNEENDDTTSSI